MDTRQHGARYGIPSPIVPQNDDTAAPNSSKWIYSPEELAAATAHFQERAPWAWKRYEEAEESGKREVRRLVRKRRRVKRLADWWGESIVVSHQDPKKHCIPLSPSVHTSSGESSSEDECEKKYRIRDNESRIGAQCWARYRSDHARACGGGLVPVPQRPFQFMDLPAEIRLQVFRILLTREKDVAQLPVNNPTKDFKRLPVDTRVFAVSSGVKEEAEQVFYRSNTFCVDAHDLLPLFIQHLAGTEAASAKAAFRSIHVRLIYTNPPAGSPGSVEALRARDDLQQRLQMIARALKQCTHLTQIRLTPIARVRRFNELGLSRKFDELVGVFAEVQDIEDVVFTDAQMINNKYYSKVGRTRIRALGSEQQTERLKALMQRPKVSGSCKG